MFVVDEFKSSAFSILKDWLETVDVVYLDSALCCRKMRFKFLQTIQSDGFVVNGVALKQMSNVCGMEQWLTRRQCKVCSVAIDFGYESGGKVESSVTKHIYSRLKEIDVHYNSYWMLATTHCAHSLRSVTLRGSKFRYPTIIDFIGRCKLLQQLAVYASHLEYSSAEEKIKVEGVLATLTSPLTLLSVRFIVTEKQSSSFLSALLSRCDCLRAIDLNECSRISNDVVISLLRSESVNTLQMLSVPHITTIPLTAVDQLFDCCPQLSTLELSGAVLSNCLLVYSVKQQTKRLEVLLESMVSLAKRRHAYVNDLNRLGVHTHLLAVLRECVPVDLNVTKLGMQAMQFFSYLNSDSLGADGFCKLLTDALTLYGALSADLALACFSIVQHIVCSYKRQFVNQGIGNILATALQRIATSPPTVKDTDLTDLTRPLDFNNERLLLAILQSISRFSNCTLGCSMLGTEAHLIPAVVRVLEVYGMHSHVTAEMCLAVIANIAGHTAAYQRAMSCASTCGAVAKALKTYVFLSHPTVAAAARAVSALSYRNAQNKLHFKSTATTTYIVNALRYMVQGPRRHSTHSADEIHELLVELSAAVFYLAQQHAGLTSHLLNMHVDEDLQAIECNLCMPVEVRNGAKRAKEQLQFTREECAAYHTLH